jgi:hypothetical protein
MKLPYLISVFFLLLIAFPSNGQEKQADSLYSVTDTLTEQHELFGSNDPLNISLKFDISRYRWTKSDTEYLKATLTYYINDKDSITKNIKVRSRGTFRRNYCDFPPLMLNFHKKDSSKGEFANIKKLKLVTDCKPGRDDYVLKEYLAYRLYNILTENSFRVRLLRVRYVNTAKQDKSETQFAFVIEPVEMLAKRINAVEIKSKNLTQKNVKPEMMDRAAIFNYMIGNTDWSVPIQHNMLILTQPKSERPDLGVIIPYDFDFSGLVNTNYSSPFPGLKIKTVRERLYLGICRNEETYINALKEFAEKKDAFYREINNFPYLKEKTKLEMISYLEEFFKGINEKNTTAKKLIYDCLKF